MQLDPVLEAIKLRIVKAVNSAWDSNWHGENSAYQLTPVKKYNELLLTTLSYPVNSKWVYFTSNIEVASIEHAFKELLIERNSSVGILGTTEFEYDYSLAIHDLCESFKVTNKLAVDNGVIVRIATTKGQWSKHIYVEFDKAYNEMAQKFVFIMVIRDTTN